jgi:putative transposase
MRCSVCGSAAISERPERTTQGYRRYRCGTCSKQFNERSVGVLNRAQYPSDVIALVVLWRLRYKLSLRDLAEMFLTRGFIFSYEAVRDWEAKLTPALAENLRRRRKGSNGPSWYIDEVLSGLAPKTPERVIPSIHSSRVQSESGALSAMHARKFENLLRWRQT